MTNHDPNQLTAALEHPVLTMEDRTEQMSHEKGLYDPGDFEQIEQHADVLGSFMAFLDSREGVLVMFQQFLDSQVGADDG